MAGSYLESALLGKKSSGARDSRSFLKTGVAALSLLLPVAAHAQSVPQDSENASGKLDEIVVTAQKRSENLQKVPVAIAAFKGETLAKSGVDRIGDLGQVDPAIKFSTGAGAVVPFLRGVGNPSGTAVGNEASVPIYIDDVYYTRLDHIYLELNNVERVEVLKGPQGTLFGRNASGGLVQIFTRDPMKGAALDASVGYANYDTISGKFYGAVPLGDRAAIDLSVSGLHQDDGWGRVIATGEKVNRVKFITARSKLVIEPTDTTRVRVIGYYGNIRTSQFLHNTIFRGTTNATHPFYGPIVELSPPDNFYDGAGTTEHYLTHEGWGGSIKIDQELAFADISSISAYRKSEESYLADGEMTYLNFLQYRLNASERQFTEELQLKSKAGSPFDWIVGGFYLYSKAGYVPTAVTGDAIDAAGGVPGSELQLTGIQTIKSYSGYSQATFHVVPEGTNITLGLRYTSDHVKGHGTQLIQIPGVGTFPAGATPAESFYDQSVVFNRLTYKVAVDHRFGSNLMGYVSFSRGYKSGTFNTLPLAAPPSRPEIVDAYEVGVKSDLLDRRVRLNLAVFQNNIKNPQVETIIVNGNTAFIGFTNAESAKVRGAEFSAEALVADGLRFNLSGAYLDAKYTGFENAPYLIQPTALPQNGGLCPGLTPELPQEPAVEGGNCPIVSRDASGNRMAQVPKWRFNAGLDYDLDTSAGDFNFNMNISYTGNFFWQPDNILKEKAYTLVNGSVTYSPRGNENLSVRVWGKNLTAEKYHAGELAVAGSGGNLAMTGAPRTYGAEIRYKF